MSNVDQLEREVARQLDIANSFARAQAKMEERKAATNAATLVRKQAKEQMKAMLNNPNLKRQTLLQTQPKVKQAKLQSEQLTKQLDSQMIKVNELLVGLGGEPIIKGNGEPDTPVMESQPDTDSTPKLSADEHYKQTIVTEMVALIKQRKKR